MACIERHDRAVGQGCARGSARIREVERLRSGPARAVKENEVVVFTAVQCIETVAAVAKEVIETRPADQAVITRRVLAAHAAIKDIASRPAR